MIRLSDEDAAVAAADEDYDDIDSAVAEVESEPNPEPRTAGFTRGRRILLSVGVALIVLPLTAYLGVGWQIYTTLAYADPGYGDQEGNLPDGFNVTWDEYAGFDTSPYEVDYYENVTIASRTAGIDLDCWWIPVDAQEDEPTATVVLVHGLRASKAGYRMLMVAGMLNEHGFNVLLIDLRDHGQSTVEDGMVSIGTKEYIDVMSGVDWLIDEQGIPEEMIGLWGNSMGAGTAAITFGQDERIQALVLDSGYLDLAAIVREELIREGYPGWLGPATVWAAFLFGGEALLEPSPRSAFENAGNRSIFITHGTDDGRVDLHHFEDMLGLAEDLDVNASGWLVEGTGHTEAIITNAEEYEQRITDFFTASLT